MKATESKTSATTARSSTPFFGKGDTGSFFGPRGEPTPFFSSASPAMVQTKLTIGEPNDPYEQEADAMARELMGNLDQIGGLSRQLPRWGLQPFRIQPLALGRRISRRLQTAFSGTRRVQAKCSHCEQEEKMQQKPGAVQLTGRGGGRVPGPGTSHTAQPGRRSVPGPGYPKSDGDQFRSGLQRGTSPY